MSQISSNVVATGDELTTNGSLPSGEQRRRLRKRRHAVDLFAKYGVAVGGVSVIAALGLIFVYLMYEVWPIFKSADVELRASYTVPGDPETATLHTAMERHQELGVRFDDRGEATFFEPRTGTIRNQWQLPIPVGAEVTSFAVAEVRTRVVGYGLNNGQAIVAKHEYLETFPDNRRHLEPGLEFPLGEEPLTIDPQGRPITALAVQEGSAGLSLVAATDDGRLLYIQYRASVSFMTGEVDVRETRHDLPALPAGRITALLIDSRMANLFVGDDRGTLSYYDVRQPAQARLMETQQVTAAGAEISAIAFLLGTVSLAVGGSDGSVAQWFLVRDEQNIYHLRFVRGFESHVAPVTAIAAEHQRKGFMTGDAQGHVMIHFPTSHRTLVRERIADSPIVDLAMAPRHNGAFVVDGGNRLHFLEAENQHPQVSWSSLWGKVWYEGRSEDTYVWQASSATDEFEPKFSLVPLTVGTIKAAFFAMLFAMPLAIMGAIYTAYFMTPRMRGFVKPTIEVMEALPTVILGFLAGLWLAPYVERNLPVVFAILVLIPLSMLLVAYIWHRLPKSFTARIPPGWEAALLIPVILLIGWFCVAMTPFMQLWFFNGDMRQWLTDVGINYDQRNALVVGIAMGFAVIPTIFSIAEDAIYSVPKHLTQGSLALGATPWQTVMGVVLLTASPGIFSAVMIGFGRAVGETMIVLMATGNSPVVNFNIFEGMRTLSANIAVEMPETAVGGTHFRILFLAALVLFALTFVVNTAAEIVRQRLRRKYASL